MNFLQRLLAALRPEDHGAALGLPGYSPSTPNVGSNDVGFQPDMNHVLNIGGRVVSGASQSDNPAQAAPTGGGGNAAAPIFHTSLPSNLIPDQSPSYFIPNGPTQPTGNTFALPVQNGGYGPQLSQAYVPTNYYQDPADVTPQGNPYAAAAPAPAALRSSNPRAVLAGLFGS